MHFPNQITPFTCGLACLESVSVSLGKPTSQTAMLIKYKKALIADASDGKNFGATSTALMKSIWEDFGFTGEWKKNHDIAAVRDGALKTLTPKQAVLISSHFQETAMHCIRYFGLKDEDEIFALVPSFSDDGPRQMPISFQALVDWDYEYAVITGH